MFYITCERLYFLAASFQTTRKIKNEEEKKKESLHFSASIRNNSFCEERNYVSLFGLFSLFSSLKKYQLIELKTKMVKTHMNIFLMHDSCQSILMS